MDPITTVIVRRILNADAFRRGMDSLPQELWDEIFNDVFTAAPGFRVVDHSPYMINGSKYPPIIDSFNLLHASRGTRAQYAASLYGPSSHFITRYPDSVGCHAPYLSLGWLIALSPDHCGMVQRDGLITTVAVSGATAWEIVMNGAFPQMCRSWRVDESLKVIDLSSTENLQPTHFPWVSVELQIDPMD